MFWGVTLESGKRYSQKVSESYHLSMASLETLHGDLKPQNKEVHVMLEIGEAEYQLCVLEYGRIMQVNLDLIFDCGEVVTYFLNGEGTVHLTGYALADADDDTGTRGKSGVKALSVSAAGADDDDDDEEDDEDWTPSKARVEISDSDESEESEEEDDDESENESEPEKALVQLSETNEDSDDNKRKRKNIGILKNKKTKKRKTSDSSPTQNGTSKGSKIKPENQQRMRNNFSSGDSNDNFSEKDDIPDEEEDDDDSVEYSSEDEKIISSAGRTPMPSKRLVSKSSIGQSPDLPAEQKGKAKTSDISSSNKGTIPVTPQNARKLPGNLMVEDLRIGSGPAAKSGKFVFLHYVGKLQSGKVFEACEAPKKPFSFRLGKGEVIQGLELGIDGMKAGGKRKILVPPHMGYGKENNGVIPPNSPLLFTVELKSVK